MVGCGFATIPHMATHEEDTNVGHLYAHTVKLPVFVFIFIARGITDEYFVYFY